MKRINPKDIFFGKGTGLITDRFPKKNIKIDLDGVYLEWKKEPSENYSMVSKCLMRDLRLGMEYKDAKKGDAEYYKNKLPFMLGSGYQEFGHNNTEIEFNGCIQLDIDFKYLGGDAIAKKTLKLLENDLYMVLSAISPSSFGVKALIVTDCHDKSFYSEIIHQVSEYYNPILSDMGLSDFKIDSLSVSQPLFIPNFPETRYKKKAFVFEIDKNKKKEDKNEKFVESATFEVGDESRFKINPSEKEGEKIYKKCFDVSEKNSNGKPESGNRNNFFKFFVPISLKSGLSKDMARMFLERDGFWDNENISHYNRLYNKYYKDNFAINYKKEWTSEHLTIGGKNYNYVSDILDHLDFSRFLFLQSKKGGGKTRAFLDKNLFDGNVVLVSPFKNQTNKNKELYGLNLFNGDPIKINICLDELKSFLVSFDKNKEIFILVFDNIYNLDDYEYVLYSGFKTVICLSNTKMDRRKSFYGFFEEVSVVLNEDILF